MTSEEMFASLVADSKQQIVAAAVEKLAESLSEQYLVDATAAYRQELGRQVKALVAEKLAGFENLRIPRTNAYGEPLRDGSTFTLLELMLQSAAEYLAERVSKDGSTNWGDREMTRAQYLAQKAAEELIRNQLQPAIDQAKKDFQQSLGGKLAGVFKETLRKALE